MQPYINDGQAYKRDAGKLKLSLVPPQIIADIAKVREFGCKKYGDTESWRKIGRARYIDAAYRHWLNFVREPSGVDGESHLPHLWHVACNIAFLCEMYKDDLAEVLDESNTDRPNS